LQELKVLESTLSFAFYVMICNFEQGICNSTNKEGGKKKEQKWGSVINIEKKKLDYGMNQEIYAQNVQKEREK
jgi:hypothetical protein